MRALVVGGGSIGSRHLRNLRALGVAALALVEPHAGRREMSCSESEAEGFASLEAGLEWRPDLVMIGTPSHLHAEQALAAARRGCHLFIEKPLAHTSEGLDELRREVRERGLITLIGCNMRFHPGPGQVKRLLDDGRIGRLLFARVHTGSYLPAWRPQQDYRTSYSARREMGGGCVLDCIHEIDLTRWYMGEVAEVFCCAGHLSSLEVDVEDVAAIICRDASGALSEVHLDFVQRTYERGCQIVGERGSVFWDIGAGSVRCFDAEQNSWTTFPHPDGWQMNQMYVDEMRHFLECVEKKEQTVLPVGDAISVLRVAFAAKESARRGCFVSAEGVFAE